MLAAAIVAFEVYRIGEPTFEKSLTSYDGGQSNLRDWHFVLWLFPPA